ncbi:MAG: cupredoxin domain-containing protein [Chloroflexi bacterium]|nr:cupredoxin domain-containing protein [Chloroflexota bacterium]
MVISRFLPSAFRLVVPSLFLIFAACSSSGGAAPTATPAARATAPPAAATTGAPAPTATRPPSPPSPPSGAEIKVTVKDNTFPNEIRVKAGAKVTFVVTNESMEKHSVEFPDFKFYKEIEAGQTVRFDWTVPNEKGKWDMGCFLTEPGGVHEGMEGDLIIE